MKLKKFLTAILLSISLFSCEKESSNPGHSILSFLGGAGNDSLIGIISDSGGNLYVTGKSSSSWGTPVRAYTSGDDVFAAKINTSGQIEWLTFLGGSGTDSAAGICLDSSGNIYITGTSGASWGSPNRAYTSGNDCFVARLDSTGTLLWNTFLGGSGTDTAGGICTSGNFLYVCGSSGASWTCGSLTSTQSYSSGTDIFSVCLNSSGAAQWFTFAGGTGEDLGKCMTAYGENIYLGGYSSAAWGSPVRDYTGGSDAVVIILSRTDGTRGAHTFLGGSGNEYALGITSDTDGYIFLTGYGTATWGLPSRAHSGGDDGFAACINQSLVLSWNTFLGGTGDDKGCSVCITDSGICIAGTGDATWGEPGRSYTGGTDAFVTTLSVNGTLQVINFYGSAGSDLANGITQGAGGKVFISGYSSAAWGSPVTQYSSGQDGFIAQTE